MDDFDHDLRHWIEEKTGFQLDLEASFQPVGGGCINETRLYPTKDSNATGPAQLFVKINQADQLEMFEAEAAGLNLLRNSGAIRIPEPYANGIVYQKAVFVMEGIALVSRTDTEHQSRLGHALAELHQTLAPDGKYGAGFDNHIGKTPQKNDRSENWGQFFIEQRLEYQFELAADKGWSLSRKEKKSFYRAIDYLLTDYTPTPSLLHGDLWGGNVGFDEVGNPVIYDPACYYGDPEAEIAFTGMFGGFSSAFYRAYREIHPACELSQIRHRLYNLYHELNHFNLFGGGYRNQAESTIRFLGGSVR